MMSVRSIWPHPYASLALAAAWLALEGSLEAADLALAGLIGTALPQLLRSQLPRPIAIRRPLLVLALIGRLLLDVVVSSLQVARRVLGPEHAIRPRFIWVPLELRNPHAIAAFAAMITMTPGTLSADLSEDRRWLLIHAFDVDDEATLARQIKSRYERPLQEILP